MAIARRLFVNALDPAPLLAELVSDRGGFVPTRVRLQKGERVLLDVRIGDDPAVQVPVVVAERRLQRSRRRGDVGVVVKVVGDA